MTAQTLVALISAGATILAALIALIGVFVKLKQINNEVVNQLKTSQAVTNAKMEELTREVREHNSFGRLIPVMQEQIRELQSEVRKLQSFHERRES